MNKFITMIACLLISMGMSGHFLSKLNSKKENSIFSFDQSNLKKQIINNEFNNIQKSDKVVVKQKIGYWSNWEYLENLKKCEIWNPDTNFHTWGKEIKQTRTCSIRKERRRPIYDIYQNGKEQFNSYEIDFKIIKKIEEKIVLGTKNIIEKRIFGEWSQWRNIDDCKQKFHCSKTLKRIRIIYDVYSDGSKLAVDSEIEQKIIN